MEKKSDFFQKIPVLSVTLVFAFLSATVFHTMRGYWVFYEPNIAFLGGATGVFLIMLLIIAVLLLLLALRLYAPKFCQTHQKAFKVLSIIAFVVSALTVIANAVILALSDAEIYSVFFMRLKDDLPLIFVVAAFALMILILPILKGKAKAIFAVFMAIVVCVSAFLNVFPIKRFQFVSDPVVMDTGDGYSVVFATNDTGIACITYEYKGKEYVLYDQKNGRRIGDRRIHSVKVPYAHLKNNDYQIGSTRVIEQFSYGSRLGKKITAGPFRLKVNESSKQEYLCISDWHSYVNDAKAAIASLGSYDAVIMLGDPVTGMDFEEQAVRYIVRFGGELTHGKIPVIYARGNHETRGSKAAYLADYLGYEHFYYTASRGDYSFIVLDSGEDKPDEHREYGSMVEYRNNREQMLQWLESLPENDGKKTIVLSHAWQVSEPEAEISKAAWDALEARQVSFMISGHMHVCEFLKDDNSEEAIEHQKNYPEITTYIDGGHAGKTFVASKLTLSEEGVFFEAANNNGEKVIEKTIPWR